mgnify:CR=1 FL=1|jgi:hypothetical protein
MKFVLIIWVCSFIQGNACMPPMEYKKAFDSWYECSQAAHSESKRVLSKMGYYHVNQYQVGTKYICKKVRTH